MGFFLVVTSGADEGKRVLVDEQPRIVGRARGADLALTDLTVSRKHLEVTATREGVDVRLCTGASAFVVGDEARERATLRVDDRVVIGNTVLTVVPSQGEVRADGEVTSVRTLLGGMATDVRGLAAVFHLTEALDAVEDRQHLEAVLAAWAAQHANAAGCTLRVEDDADGGVVAARPDEVTERAAGAEIEIVVPADAGVRIAIAFRVVLPAAKLDDPLRRLLVVAARVCASSLARVRAMRSILDDNAALRRLAVGSAQAFLGASSAAEQVAKVIPRLAASDVCVLLLGESGTGKTFVARLLHEMGPRAREPLRVLNCAAVPESLLESELFGHERGAFTGAIASREGVFEAAGRGTVLLDEIGELPLTSQAKLLRVLEDKRFERVGSNRSLSLGARILAATNRDLERMVEEGRFRRDLYFRISVVNLKVPALRERGEDVVLLARQILGDLSVGAGRRVRDYSPAALETIRRYGWPGNVRELRNAIEHALVLGDGPLIEPSDLPDVVRGTAARQPAAGEDQDEVRLPARLDELEVRAIGAAMRATGGNRTRAAALLGINRVTLYKKLREDPQGG